MAHSAENAAPTMVAAANIAPQWDEPELPAAHTRCEQCHTMAPLFSHPVNITPKSSIPSQFPLDHGRMTCQTCHTSESGHSRGSGPMLRTSSDGANFCQQCHSSGGRDAASAHAAGLGRAHLDSGHSRSSEISQFGRPTLDAESTTCVTCHDGTFGADAGNHDALSRFGERNPRSDHPIGVDYRGRRTPGSDLWLVDPSRLDHRVRLFDRTVGCGSCHSPYSSLPDQLVVSNQRSQLCLTCHAQ